MTNQHEDDRISAILKGVVVRVEREVIPPDIQVITERSKRQQHRRWYRLLSVAAAAAIIAGMAVTSVIRTNRPTTGQDGRIGSQSQSVPSYPVRFGNIRLVIKDLPAIAKKTSTKSRSKVMSRHLPLISPNYSSIAFGARSVWVLEEAGGRPSTACGKLIKVNASSVTVSGSVGISLCPTAVAYGAGSVWVLSFQIGVSGYQLVRVDPITLRIRSTTTIDGGSGGVTPQGDTGAKYLFVTVDGNNVVTAVQGQTGSTELVEIDATTGTIIRSATIPSRYGPVSGLSANSSALWVGTWNGWVFSFNPKSGKLSNGRRLGTRVASLSASDSGVWVTVNLPVPANTNYPGLDTLRLDPMTGAIKQDTGLPMVWVATDGTSVWALSSAPPYLSATGLVGNINSITGGMNEQVELPVIGYNAPDTLGVHAGNAWVINDGAGTLTRVSP